MSWHVTLHCMQIHLAQFIMSAAIESLPTVRQPHCKQSCASKCTSDRLPPAIISSVFDGHTCSVSANGNLAVVHMLGWYALLWALLRPHLTPKTTPTPLLLLHMCVLQGGVGVWRRRNDARQAAAAQGHI